MTATRSRMLTIIALVQSWTQYSLTRRLALVLLLAENETNVSPNWYVHICRLECLKIQKGLARV